jgi:hypothetical protein
MQSKEINQVVEKVESFIQNPRLDDGVYNEEFNEVALALYDLHRKYNPVYAKYNIGELDDWNKIPLMPISEYKFSDVGLEIEGSMPFPGVEFHSSGTTIGDKSKHRMFSTQTYRLAILKGLGGMILDSMAPQYRVVLLSPTLPNSSLYYMMQYITDQLDYRGLREQWYEFDNQELVREQIESLRGEDHPVILFGTSLAFYDLMQTLKGLDGLEDLKLPEGSILIETGGWKGRDIKIAPEALTEATGKFFGIPEWNLIREYSMSELSSQLYCWNSLEGPNYHNPHWMGVKLVEPLTQRPVDYKESGIIGFVDLANVWSCPFVLTEDMGHFKESLWGDSVLVLEGRATNAPEKGCSLTYAQAMDR